MRQESELKDLEATQYTYRLGGGFLHSDPVSILVGGWFFFSLQYVQSEDLKLAQQADLKLDNPLSVLGNSINNFPKTFKWQNQPYDNIVPIVIIPTCVCYIMTDHDLSVLVYKLPMDFYASAGAFELEATFCSDLT